LDEVASHRRERGERGIAPECVPWRVHLVQPSPNRVRADALWPETRRNLKRYCIEMCPPMSAGISLFFRRQLLKAF